jgi:phosphoribosylcarboxyaminoimidazole (NCAIR) mutase
MAAFFLLFGVAVSRAAVTGQTRVLTRISNETGVPVSTLQTQKSATGLGNGELETANLLANASGKSFDDIVAMHKAGEGWGEIAHDNGLNLGKTVSSAHRSDRAALHARNTHGQNVHGKSNVHGESATGFGKGHASTMSGVGRGASIKSGRGPVRGMGSTGRGHGGR